MESNNNKQPTQNQSLNHNQKQTPNKQPDSQIHFPLNNGLALNDTIEGGFHFNPQIDETIIVQPQIIPTNVNPQGDSFGHQYPQRNNKHSRKSQDDQNYPQNSKKFQPQIVNQDHSNDPNKQTHKQQQKHPSKKFTNNYHKKDDRNSFQKTYNNKEANRQIDKDNQNELRGIYMIDEIGNEFIRTDSASSRIKISEKVDKRLLIENEVIFELVTFQYNYNFQIQKAKILKVIQPYQIDPLVGIIGRKKFYDCPIIDFNIQQKKIEFDEGEDEFYFYPLDLKYPRMLLRLKNEEEATENLIKRYHRVQLIDWPIELSEIGPICEIIEELGPLYDQQSDIEALLSMIGQRNKKKKKTVEEEKVILKDYSDKLKSGDVLDCTDLAVFSIDKKGTRAFDDSFSVQFISQEALEKERARAAQGPSSFKQKKNEENKLEENQKKQKKKKKISKKSKKVENDEEQQEEKILDPFVQKQNEGEVEEENQLDQPNLSQNNENSSSVMQPGYDSSYPESNILRLGIHISDFADLIEENSEIYKQIKEVGESIYLELGNGSVHHPMFPQSLVDQFSLRMNNDRLAQSLFVCLRINDKQDFEILNDTIYLEKTKINIKKNFSYQDIDSEKKISDVILAQIFNGSNYPLFFLKQFGLWLFNKRDEKGHLLLQQSHERENKDDKLKQQEINDMRKGIVHASSVTEELMIFHNQSISKILLARNHIASGSKEKEKKITIINNQKLKQLKEVQNIIQKTNQDLKKKQNGLDMIKKQNAKIYKKIKAFEQSIKDAPKILKTRQKALQNHISQQEILQNKIIILEILLQEKKSNFDDILSTSKSLNESSLSESDNDSEQSSFLSNSPSLQSEKTNNSLQEEDFLDLLNDSTELLPVEPYDMLANQKEEKQIENRLRKMQYEQLNNKIEEEKISLQKIEDDLQSLEQPSQNEEELEKKKKKAKKSLDFFEKSLIQMQIHGFQIDTLELFRKSMQAVDMNNDIPKIIKQYLHYEQKNVLHFIHFYIESQDELSQALKQRMNKISGLKSQISKIVISLEQLEKEREILKDSIKDDVEEFKEEKEEDEVEFDQMDDYSQNISEKEQDQVSSKKNKSKKGKTCPEKKEIKRLEYQIEQLKEKIKNSEKKFGQINSLIEKNGQILEKGEKEIEKLNKQLQPLIIQEEIATSQFQKLEELLSIQQNKKQQLENKFEEDIKEIGALLSEEADSLFNILDIKTSQSSYLTGSSPIRKFQDLLLINHLNQYYFTQEIDSKTEMKKYQLLINTKKNNSIKRSNYKYFYEKANKLISCRKKILDETINGIPYEQTEEILFIKEADNIKNQRQLDFFIPGQFKVERFQFERTLNKNKFALFGIWNSVSYPCLNLPYRMKLQQVVIEETYKGYLNRHIFCQDRY